MKFPERIPSEVDAVAASQGFLTCLMPSRELRRLISKGKDKGCNEIYRVHNVRMRDDKATPKKIGIKRL